MDFSLRMLAVVGGVILLLVYFRSIVVVTLLNSRSKDVIERVARTIAVTIVHGAIGKKTEHYRIQQSQAWIMPLFILICVIIWFLLVQLAFTGILWGLQIEPDIWRALSASGSALSTLGFLTPSSLAGEYLAVFQAAIGLAIVMLLFTFVPGYQAAVQTRERKVSWLYTRTNEAPTAELFFRWLQGSNGQGRFLDGWEEWEEWFRGVRETHLQSPIVAYVPSIYKGKSWVVAASTVLDMTSLVIACLQRGAPDSARMCRLLGVNTLQLVALELDGRAPIVDQEMPEASKAKVAEFDTVYDAMAKAGLPVAEDKAACLREYLAMRAEYAPYLKQIANATLTPRDLLAT
ncbi:MULTISPECIES: hypothetical protein [unclassified Chelatococcus]|uniref:hypothetical protein n=1 Tax=unclassified Chelatococcus TaxID=2638111 RepID=UPI001BCBF63B|nr:MULTISPECIES: hypothetical protein [unclassified Chelatococcus]CAH1668824.1 conserved membrane hypothetical protein [Hyphomicrobiales bacterium]MBS7738126.1 hypothetical protein [Chelatococcus sp. HY11]MBX3546927.1 hypothetical protein [Chelatococcus sp.]MCO5077528.1 hypothetical protein [Chelatococcus sp.]CAH1678949.1 conserved membrane hypothetical protein [Hyphomicrobiales bacterium]